MASKGTSGRARKAKPTKRARRRGMPGQGRLRRRQITIADISRCADAGNVPPARHHTFEQWLRSTLEFSWLADRHFHGTKPLTSRTPELRGTLSSKKAALTRVLRATSKLQRELDKDDVRNHLLGATLQRQILGRTVSEARYQKLQKASSERVRRLVRYNAWSEAVLKHDLKHLGRRPESGDERIARKPAHKPAVEHVTGMIIDFWQGPLGLGRRPAKAAAMADFAAAVFRLAGDRGASRETAIERLKAALRSRR